MSRLLDAPGDTVVCEVREPVKGRYGELSYRPTGATVTVPCNVHPLKFDERVQLGTQHEVTHRVVARLWPVDEHATVLWGGYRWEQTMVERRDTSPRTRHTVVHLRRLETLDGDDL